MTPSEKTVWAAVFAQDMGEHKSIPRACEVATYAVRSLRNYAEGDVARDNGEDDDVTRMTREMVGDYEGA